MYYVADDKAIRDSRNDLDDTENDIKIADLKKLLYAYRHGIIKEKR